MSTKPTDDTPNPDEPHLPTAREQWTPVIKALIEVTDPSRRFEDAMVRLSERMMQAEPRSVRFENIGLPKDEPSAPPPTPLRARVDALALTLLGVADETDVEVLADVFTEILAGKEYTSRTHPNDNEEELRTNLRRAAARFALHRWAKKIRAKQQEGGST